MGRHLYCIVPRGQRPPDGLRGLDGAPVESEDASSCSVWSSPAPRRPEPRVELLRRHDLVVRVALRESGAALPVRFGQWFASTDALLQGVEERADGYARHLRQVRGCVEFGLRIRVAPAPGAQAEGRAPAAHADVEVQAEATPAGVEGPGRAYLEALAQREVERREACRRAEAVAEELEEHLGALVRRQRVHRLRGEREELCVAHLVRRGDVADYRRALSGFAEGRRELPMRPSGPWPPYSFVS